MPDDWQLILLWALALAGLVGGWWERIEDARERRAKHLRRDWA